MILGQPEAAWICYEQAAKLAPNEEKWVEAAVVDLEKHGERLRTSPSSPLFIAKVKGLVKSSQTEYLHIC